MNYLKRTMLALAKTGDTEMIFTAPKDERTESYITGRIG